MQEQYGWKSTAVLLALICGFGLIGALLDLDDLQTPIDAQESAIKEEEKQRNAQVFCTATAGESVVVWDADGEFNCKRRKK